jgi:hypothetical protein
MRLRIPQHTTRFPGDEPICTDDRIVHCDNPIRAFQSESERLHDSHMVKQPKLLDIAYLALASMGMACSSGSEVTYDGGSDSGPTLSVEEAYCNAYSDRAKCFDGGAPRSCGTENRCFARLMDPKATEAFASCFAFPACVATKDGMSTGPCLNEAGRTVGGQAARDYFEACAAKAKECGGKYSDDICEASVFAYAGVGSGASSCLTKPCSDQKACFDALLAPLKACK